MNYTTNDRTQPVRGLLIWDGRDDFVKVADHFLIEKGCDDIAAVQVLPHESIYAYATVGQEFDEPSVLERKLEMAFKLAVRETTTLKHAIFELVFGNRITEIARFANAFRANYILIPRFDQSRFSKWIHGDLNERLVDIASCEIVFLNSLIDAQKSTKAKLNHELSDEGNRWSASTCRK